MGPMTSHQTTPSRGLGSRGEEIDPALVATTIAFLYVSTLDFKGNSKPFSSETMSRRWMRPPRPNEGAAAATSFAPVADPRFRGERDEFEGG